MSISDRTKTFFGKRVQDYQGGDITVAPGIVHCLHIKNENDSMEALLKEYLSKIDKSSLEALILGSWSEPYEDSPNDAFDVLIQHAADLTGLKALFVGDMTSEECEISWITQGSYEYLLRVFPSLEVLCIRGSKSLEFSAFSHAALRELTIESGGLPREVSESLAQSTLPALERLELWLGTENYGFEGDVDLVRSVLQQLRTPKLRHIGLRDSEIADSLAVWLATESWVADLDTLDLSLGTLGDIGATALLASPYVAKLKRLDLSHHYISEPLQAQLRAAIPGVVLDDPQEEDDGDRYVAVGE